MLKFLKPSAKKLFLAFALFLVVLYFFFPAKVNVICKTYGECPPVNRFIRITTDNPRYISANYQYIILEFILAYLVSAFSVEEYIHLRRLSKEKQLKNWKRQWKQKLIEKNNPMYQDLSDDWDEPGDSGSSPEWQVIINPVILNL